MTAQRAPTARRRGSSLRCLLTYALVSLVGLLALAIVVPIGNGIEAAPQAPTLGAVEGAMTRCLGDRVATVQSGVFVDLHEVPAPDASVGESASRLGSGRIHAGTGSVTLEGVCLQDTPLGGESFSLDLTVREDPNSLEGSALVRGERVPLVIEATEAPAQTVARERLGGSDLAGRIFLAVAVVIVAARGAGMLFSRIRQPRVVGEIVAGIILGPSLLGAYFPAVTGYLFPPEVTSVLRTLADFGLIFFMFLIGLELDHRLMRGSGRTAILVSHVSIVLPFALGLVLALSLYPLLGSGNFLGFGLFMGAAMAITAFPVLARILTDTGIHRTRLGALAITCAAVGDITAWCILAVVVAVVTSAGAGGAVQTIALSAVFVVVMLLVVRPLIARLAVVHEARGRLNPPVMAAIIIALLLSAWMTEQIGIHAIFGAFLLGAVMPRSPRLTEEITGKLEDVTVLLLLPVFFAVMGLSTRFDLLDRAELWGVAGLVIAVAVVGKWGGSMLAARAAGEGWRHSAGLGILMNARGLTEIVILTIGRELGIISPALFTIMVLMALVTTFMTTPLLSMVYPRQTIDWELYRDSGIARRIRRDGTRRVLVALGGSDRDERLLAVAAALRAPDSRPPELVLAQVVAPPGREEVRGRLAALDEAVSAAATRLAPRRDQLVLDGVSASVRTAAAIDVGAEVARLAAEERVDLVLLGWHRAYLGRNLLKGVPGELLRIGAHDVAVLLEDDNRVAPPDGPIALWYNGPATGGAALDVAASMARGLGTSLRVAHGAHVEAVELPVAGVEIEWLRFAELDVDLVQQAFNDAQLMVMGEFQRSTWRASPREQLIRAVTCPVLVVQGARCPVGSPAPP